MDEPENHLRKLLLDITFILLAKNLFLFCKLNGFVIRFNFSVILFDQIIVSTQIILHGLF